LTKLFTYQKEDKLKSRKQTQFLFAKGQSMNAFPVKLIYTIETVSSLNELLPSPPNNISIIKEKGLLQVGVGAPSRTFKKAVARNRIKRLLREGFRLEKPVFIANTILKGHRVNLFFLYTDVTILTQKEIQEKIKQLLNRLSEKLSNNHKSINKHHTTL